jgi:hypothetical protein
VRHRCYTTATSSSKDSQPSNRAHEHRAWSEVAEAEGFEPPVPLSTLAFKVIATPFTSIHEMRYRWSQGGIRYHSDCGERA